MDKNQSVRLLDETFNNDFDVNRFVKFIKELFNNFEINPKSWTVWEAFQDYIESFQLIGSYEDSSKKIIDVLTVKLRRTGSVDRARTMQRNFIAKWLSNAEKEAALVAFYGDDPQDWRFSFVKMEYQLVKEIDGKVKIAKELTPAKRYSFLVGVNEPNHTCKSQFVSLLEQEEFNPSIEQIEAAFSIDKVTKEFFIQYKELYLKLKEAVEKFIRKDKNIREEFEEKAISTVDFTKKLMGQIVFIYFLQKKGWLGVEKDKGKFKEWGTGPKNFLRKLFEKKNYENFFNDVLEPLFYEALATERDDDYYRLFECKIPFLNGGLFEPMNEYNWRETDLLLDNSIFSEILDAFDQYNFTVKEDEPLEKEVAIDPEMLGKVFENLIEENIRKGQGAYYTPREIVHYMCQQSLINYLETNTGISQEDIEKFIQLGDFAIDILVKEKENVKRYGRSYVSDKNHKLPKSIRENYRKIDDLLKHIKIVDPAVGSGAFPVGMMNEIVKARSILSIFFNDEEQKERTNYALKREVIENCLYGVDIDSSAVDIAKLRFWLSLIVDELDMKNIKPLPNLDHKIMCGNSLLEEFEGVKLFDEKLLGEVKKDYSFEVKQINAEISKLNQELHQIHTGKIKNNNGRSKEIVNEIKKLQRKKEQILSAPKEQAQQATIGDSLQKRVKESQKKLKELKDLQQKFFNEQNRKLKKQYRDDIERIEWELVEETLKEQGNEEAMKKLQQYKKNKSKPFFLWKLYFAEVFQRKNPGFDVVIANPPYVRQEEIKQFKEYFQKEFKVYTGTSDLYTYFYEKGLNILRNSGTLTFISSNKFMRAKYGIKLRQHLKQRTHIISIIDFGSEHVFDAITNTSIVILKNIDRPNNKVIFGEGIGLKNLDIISQEQLNDNEWTLANENILNLKAKIEAKGIKLLEWKVQINYGLKTGYNDAYIIDDKTKNKLESNDKNSSKLIHPLLRGRDIGRYKINWTNQWIIFVPWHCPLENDNTITGASIKAEKEFSKNYTAIYSHLLKYKKELEERNTEETGIRYEWYAMQRWGPNYYKEFSKEKIVWLELTDRNKFALSENGEFILAGAFTLTGEHLRYLLALLNSKLCLFYFNLICNSSGMSTTQWKKFALERLPIIKVGIKQQQSIIQLVDQILSITKDDDYLDNPTKQSKVKNLEKEIDQLVYKLYELTPEEIKIVEEFGK